MSRVYWIIIRRKCLVSVGLLTAQVSGVSWISNSRKCLVSVGLLAGANV